MEIVILRIEVSLQALFLLYFVQKATKVKKRALIARSYPNENSFRLCFDSHYIVGRLSVEDTYVYTIPAVIRKERKTKLLELTRLNLAHTLRMFYFNLAHEIELYRLSSSIVPLATHPEVFWDFVTPFKKQWKEIGTLIKKHHLRVSFHPNQYTLFTSPQEKITNNAVIDMEYHYRMFEAMGVEDRGMMNIHIGGAYGDKSETIVRFHENLKRLPSHIKKAMTLENDDKTYNAEETLIACEKETIPFVFDYHHHMANLCEPPIRGVAAKDFSNLGSC